MKILHTSQCALPYTRNGVTRAIEIAAHELTSLGHAFTLLAPSLPQADRYAYHTPVTAWQPRFMPKDYPLSWPLSPKLRRQLREQRWDVVHCHHPFGLGVEGLKLAQARRIPCVATFHTRYDEYLRIYGKCLPQTLVQPLQWQYLRWFFNTCDMVIAPSRYIHDFMLAHGITTPCRVLPTAVPLPRSELNAAAMRQHVRQQLDIPLSAMVVTTVGRIAHEKNIATWLTALQRAITLLPDQNVHGIIVGDGPAREHYLQLTKQLGMSARVRFVGSVPPDHVAEYLFASDVFATASRTETQGLTVCEAQACGIPPLVMIGSGITDAITCNRDGWIAQNDEHFADSLCYLLRNADERTALGAAARKTAEQRTPEQHARQLVAIYSELREARRLSLIP